MPLYLILERIFYILFIGIFVLLWKAISGLFTGLSNMSEGAGSTTSRGGVLDASQIKTYSDDEDKTELKEDKEL